MNFKIIRNWGEDKMVSLPEPSRDVALRVVGEVDFEERLLGVKMRPMVGNQEHFIYSVKEVLEFLRMERVEDLLTPGSKEYVGYIDLRILERWMAEIIKDKDLAQAIKGESERSDNFKDQVAGIKTLIAQRFDQCVALLGIG
jgi:hypothetical protein